MSQSTEPLNNLERIREQVEIAEAIALTHLAIPTEALKDLRSLINLVDDTKEKLKTAIGELNQARDDIRELERELTLARKQ